MLTATWLLPVALVPMTWDAGDIHGPVGPPPDWDSVAAEAAAAAAAAVKEQEDNNTPETKIKSKSKSIFRW